MFSFLKNTYFIESLLDKLSSSFNNLNIGLFSVVTTELSDRSWGDLNHECCSICTRQLDGWNFIRMGLSKNFHVRFFLLSLMKSLKSWLFFLGSWLLRCQNQFGSTVCSWACYRCSWEKRWYYHDCILWCDEFTSGRRSRSLF